MIIDQVESVRFMSMSIYLYIPVITVIIQYILHAVIDTHTHTHTHIHIYIYTHVILIYASYVKKWKSRYHNRRHVVVIHEVVHVVRHVVV